MALNPNNPRGPYRKADPVQRFWSKTKVDGGCIVWTGSVDNHGYGSFGVSTPKRKIERAHRWLYERVFGEQPPDRVIRHSCDNPACVKLQHLEAGTQIQNMKECADRDRFRIGVRVEKTMKLSDDDVVEVQRLLDAGVSQSGIARRYGVRSQTINGIARGKRRR